MTSTDTTASEEVAKLRRTVKRIVAAAVGTVALVSVVNVASIGPGNDKAVAEHNARCAELADPNWSGGIDSLEEIRRDMLKGCR